jgi:hypothetical protein
MRNRLVGARRLSAIKPAPGRLGQGRQDGNEGLVAPFSARSYDRFLSHELDHSPITDWSFAVINDLQARKE